MKKLRLVIVTLLLTFLLSDCKKDDPKPIVLSKAELQSPADGSKDISNTEVSFTWNISEGGTKIQYDLLFGESENPENSIASALTSASYTHNAKLKVNTKYYWKVLSQNAEGTTAESKVFSFTTRPPLTKAVLKKPTDSETQVDLTPEFSWQPSTGGTGIKYDLYFGGDKAKLPSIKADLTSTTFQYEGTLKKDSVYFWKVVSKNAESETAESDIFTFYTLWSVTPAVLQKPTDVAKDLEIPIEFEWNPSVSDDGSSIKYNLYFGQESNALTKVGADLTDTKYTYNQNIDYNKTYNWKVVSINAKGRFAFSEVFSFSPRAPLSKAVLSTPADASTTGNTLQPDFSWDASVGGSGIVYEFHFSTDNKSFSKLGDDLTTTTYKYAGSKLQYGSTYYWKILSKNDQGETAESEVFSFMTRPPLTKAVLKKPANAETDVSLTPTFTWDASKGGSQIKYDLYFGEDKSTLTKTGSDLATSTYTYSGSLEKSKTYYWKVHSKNAENETAESDIFSFATTIDVITPILINPENDITVSATTSNFNFSWKKSVFDAGGKYDLYFDENPNPTTIIGKDLKDITYTHPNPKNSTVYYWKVVASNSSGVKMESQVFKISTDAWVETLAGNGGGATPIDGIGENARITYPYGIELNKAEDILYVSSHDTFIRIIDIPTKYVKTKYYSIVPKPFIYSIAVDQLDSVYIVSDFKSQIAKVTKTDELRNIIATSGGWGGFRNSSIKYSFVQNPKDMTADSKGNLYVADAGNHCIRYIDFINDRVVTVAGKCEESGYVDGDNDDARFNYPHGIALSPTGNELYVSENRNHRIRKIDLVKNKVTTFAGSTMGFNNGNGNVAKFNSPSFIACDHLGNVIVADQKNHCIRKITPSGVVSTLAGNCGVSGYRNGLGKQALFNDPVGVAVDKNGKVYVAESYGKKIRTVTQ